MELKETTTEGYRKHYAIDGGKILLFGDTHFSSSFTGSHISYIEECYSNMETILNIVSERKPKAVFFAGDIIGVNERNIKDRQFLMRVVMFFGMLYNITNGNVYSVKGNHDVGDFTDYDFLVGLGYIKNPSYVDYIANNGTELRFHFVNYGEENAELQIHKDGASNIVIGHMDYYIDGVTSWYIPYKKRIELKQLKNFNDVDIVFSGHIHYPSDEMYYTTMSNGSDCGLFYLGAIGRVAERIDNCWYVEFEYQPESLSTTYNAYIFPMKPASEVFYEDTSKEEDEEDEVVHESKMIDVIVQEIFENRLATGDLFKQIDKIPADEECKEIAKKYLQKAMDCED